MLGLDTTKVSNQKKSKKEGSKAPVTTADEWFQREGLSVWPIPVASEGELDITSIEHKIESKSQLLEDLKNHASFDINVLDGLLGTVNVLEKSLNKYANQVLEFKEEGEVQKNSPDKAEDILDETADAKSLPSWQAKKSEVFIGSKNRTVEQTMFPGFRSNELTPMPGSLEAPQLLNRVTNIQHFRGSFKKLWKQHFLSDATVAIFQDTFWWWFLDRYQSDAKSQALLFNRLADSFVGLFLSIPTAEKDLFFRRFADCLAQAVYSAFCESFPMSFKLFNDEFRNDLLNMLSEWITGIRPPPHSWKSWDLGLLESDQIRALENDRTQQLKSSLSFDQENFLEFEPHNPKIERQVTFQHTSQAKIKGNVKESHQAGPGPEFQRVSFNLHGKSPLISHFLAANRLQFEEPAAVKSLVTRTEIEKYPPLFPTYQELISERKREAKISSKKYIAAMRRSTEDRQQEISPKHRNVQNVLRDEVAVETDKIDTSILNDKLDAISIQSGSEAETAAADSDEDLYWSEEDV